MSGASRISRVCHIAANSNGSHKTVEQLEHRRKDMCVEMLRECYMSAQKLLNNMVESEEFRSCITEGKPGELAPNSVAEAKAMVKATMRECETLMNRRAAEGPNWYNIDGNLRLAVQDALSIIPLALGKVQLWMEAPMTAYDINCVPMRECQLLRITRAALQLDDAIDRQSREDVLKSARKLCHLSDLIVFCVGASIHNWTLPEASGIMLRASCTARRKFPHTDRRGSAMPASNSVSLSHRTISRRHCFPTAKSTWAYCPFNYTKSQSAG